MTRKKQCSQCLIGKYLLNLDDRSPMCPYLACHDGKRCGMYRRMTKPCKQNKTQNMDK